MKHQTPAPVSRTIDTIPAQKEFATLASLVEKARKEEKVGRALVRQIEETVDSLSTLLCDIGKFVTVSNAELGARICTFSKEFQRQVRFLSQPLVSPEKTKLALDGVTRVLAAAALKH